jgi:hypothetical protein
MTRTTIRSEDITAGQVKSADLASDAVDTTSLETDIALLGFYVASNGSLAKYNLADQAVDTFTDSTGIDSSSTNETRVSGYVYGATANYMGDGSDGALSTTGNVTHTVQNTNGSYDGDMVVKQYSSLTINAGHTMTVNQPCRGMFIYVSGNCTINGTLSMTGKGAAADPTASGGSDSNAVGTNGLQLGLITQSGTGTFTNDGTGFNGAGTAVRTATANTANISSDGTIFSISKLGASAVTGPTDSDSGYAFGYNGNNGTTGGATISTGSGGTGQIQKDGGSSYGAGGGGAGGAFSGGAGGGGRYRNNGSGGYAGDGGNYGGAGGAGLTSAVVPAAGGAGNPKGALGNTSNDSRHYAEAEDGVGGIIWLLVGGTLEIGANGLIEAKGKRGGNAYVDGGSSGGGAIFVLHTGTYTVDNTNSTPINADGGAVNNDDGPSYTAGAGGNGGFHTAQLATITGDLTLISTTTTAESQPNNVDLVMTYSDGAGTAVVGTDLKVYASRDAGSNWTELTMTNIGTTGGHKVLTAHNVDISGQPSGTSMRYKIETLNQSASKETRIQAVSLGWS